MRKFALLFVFASACGDDGGKAIDAPAGPACTNAVYDPCTMNDQCTSMMCKLFSGDGLQVCSQTCTPGSCPMAGATAVTCNNMGFCKPPAANNCTR